MRCEGARHFWENELAPQASPGSVRHRVEVCLDARFSAGRYFRYTSCITRPLLQDGVKAFHFLGPTRSRQDSLSGVTKHTPWHHDSPILHIGFVTPWEKRSRHVQLDLVDIFLERPHLPAWSPLEHWQDRKPKRAVPVRWTTFFALPSTWRAKKKVEYTVVCPVFMGIGVHACITTCALKKYFLARPRAVE